MGRTLVTADWCRVMARYNRWQNRAAVEAAGALPIEMREADRGAFWGSIRGTLSHLLWADHMWMSRLDGWDRPDVPLADSGGFVADWAELRSKRQITDARISRWTQALDDDALAGELTWHSSLSGREVTMPRALCVAHMFNHQTHHRGQIHAMLTAAGADPGATDLLLMPDLVG
ncbi:putative damage-inducible protein DinB [Rhodovulum euryhalinum]|uniref:Putative damage-inducible protein DinB n=2 Tax=Rhodovulum euryhalinum TaxID=35805 RepID=A0A4R2KJ55_9RHOB|nr:putative damage-inducible protein DinB [Rhodovulum euryhalinum]